MFEQISIIEDMTGYNVFNILNSDGHRWLSDRYKILTDLKYRDTILYNYFQTCKCTIDEPGYSTIKLKLAIKKYVRMFKPRTQTNNEQALYIRLGDTICDSERYNQSEYLDVVERVDPGRKIVIVCCLSFSGPNATRKNWRFNSMSIDQNRLFFVKLIEKILLRTTINNIEIYSPSDPDVAICYLTSGGFISSKQSTWYKHLNFHI
jgi:hypothetical protein